MDTLQADLETLDLALRTFFQSMKRPQRWTHVVTLAGVDIDRPGAMVLQTVLAMDGQACRVSDLANMLGIEAPSVTRKTQELEAEGYLRRIRDTKDKRAITLELTTAGRNICRRLWKVQRHLIGQALQQWPAAERRAFVTAFTRFADELNQSTNHVPNTERI